MKHYRNADGQQVSELGKAEVDAIMAKNTLRPMGAETDAERRLRELQERNAELQAQLGQIEADEERVEDADALERGMRWFLEHRAAWPSMGRAGRRRAEAVYDVERVNASLLSITGLGAR